MPDSDRVRVEIGFDSGQVVGASISPQAYDALAAEMRSGDKQVVEIDTEDGKQLIALAKVAYVKRLARESRVGFGSG
jgi:hypothetical protein